MDKLREEVVKGIYHLQDEYAKTKQVNKLIDLYAEDASFESPLIPVILNREKGILIGRKEILEFLEEGTKRRPNELVQWYRNKEYFTNGNTLIWEYPRQTPDGSQIDILELMEINDDGKIISHRIYWGWFGTQMLINNKEK